MNYNINVNGTDFEVSVSEKNKVSELNPIKNPIPWPDPTEDELSSLWFNQIWNVIKTWDINVPEAYNGYCAATGNHVVAILHALNPPIKEEK